MDAYWEMMEIRNSLKLRFNLLEVGLLCQTLANERHRWVKIVRSDPESKKASNYESDMIGLDYLITEFNDYLELHDEPELTLSSQELAFIIESLENEVTAARTTLWCEKDLKPFIELRDRVKKMAEEVIGSRMHQLIHYDRNLY